MITNSNEFYTIGLIININDVTKPKWQKIIKRQKKTPHNNNCYFINARAFNTNDILFYLNSHLGIDMKSLINIKPKIYKNKISRVLIDLTKSNKIGKEHTFTDSVGALRKELNHYLKQHTNYNPSVKFKIIQTNEGFIATNKHYENNETFLHNTGFLVPSDSKFNDDVFRNNLNFLKKELSLYGDLPYKAFEGELSVELADDITTMNHVMAHIEMTEI